VNAVTGGSRTAGRRMHAEARQPRALQIMSAGACEERVPVRVEVAAALRSAFAGRAEDELIRLTPTYNEWENRLESVRFELPRCHHA